MRRLAGLALVLPLLAAPSLAETLAGFDGGVLRVRAQEVPASTVLAEVARATGVRLVVDDALASAPLTVEVETRDLEEGLRTMLRRLPGVAGHTMSWGPSAEGKLRLIEVAAFGAGGPGGEAAVFAGDSDADVSAEVERRVLELLRDLETARATPASTDLTAGLRERVRSLREAGFREDEARAAVFHAERRRRLFEELAAIPGGVDAFHRLKVRSYYEPREEDEAPPHFFSDVGDPS